MKKVFAMILAIVMLLALAGCSSDADRIAQLEAENAALKAQVAELTAQLAGSTGETGLTEWHFDAVAWEGGNGATVTFTGIPAGYEEGQTAHLSIWLEGDLIDTVSCQWNGTAYEAVTDLNAMDGYCYYCTVTGADGRETEVELNTPKNPVDGSVIDLETSLAAYCAMMVEDSAAADGVMTITAGYAQVQLPRIGRSAEPVKAIGAELVLRAEGSEVSRCDLELQAEDETTLTGEIIGLTFDLPEMEDDEQLELWMEVTLSDGQTLFTTGGSWYCNGGELFLVVG